MTQIDLLRRLASSAIELVLIGGVAVRLHGSTRVTQDVDVVARTLDLDRILQIAIRAGYCLVVSVDNAGAEVVTDLGFANRWIESTKPGSLSFVALPKDVGGLEMPVAAPADLIRLKEARTDRSTADDADIAFLRPLAENDGRN